MSVHEPASAGAAAAAVLHLTSAFPPLTSLNDALLPGQMQLCFAATLSQRECVGASVTRACKLVCTVEELSVHESFRLVNRPTFIFNKHPINRNYNGPQQRANPQLN